MADFKSLPEEMRIRILSHCEDSTLAAICRTSREMHEKALPILWSEINFVETDEHVGPQRDFLMICDRLSRDKPDRWSRLGPLVRSLEFLRMPGINVSHKPESNLERNDMDFICCSDIDDRNVYDVIAQFPNLERVSLFIKDCWDREGDLGESAEHLQRSITKLRDVTIGGQVPCEIPLALLNRPEQVEKLALINLIYSPGQDTGPEPVLFLEPIAHCFNSLTSLHLSKLAELDEDYEVAGLRWEWDAETERGLLAEWAALLDNVQSTLVTLKLENRYHVSRFLPRSDDISDWQDFLRTHGKGSSDRCREILFPVIQKHDWPALRNVKLMGIHVDDESGEPNPFERLMEQISFESLPGGHVDITDDATPMNISPPNEMFQ